MVASMVTLLISLVTPLIMEYLKTKPWAPFLQQHAPTMNRVVAVLVSIGNTVGVSAAYDAVTGTLTITGLILDDIARIGVTALLAFLTQEVVYRTQVKS